MTEQTIRQMAKDFAGAYYESAQRSEAFRNGTMTTKCFKAVHVKIGKTTVIKEVEFEIPFRVAFPNAKAYVKSAWPHWVAYARDKMTEMLTQSNERVSPLMKERIFDALIEDREKQLKGQARQLHQIKGDEQSKRVDWNVH